MSKVANVVRARRVSGNAEIHRKFSGRVDMTVKLAGYKTSFVILESS
jgi:hypothetical protein